MLRTCFAIVGTLAFAAAAHGQPTILPGITAKEIRIGNTMPYSGPASSLGLVGRVMAAYFQMVNDQGGVNGRQISFITLDDGFSPSKTVEQTRRLVENDNVAFIYGTMGTAPSSAIQKYLNVGKIPHIFLISSASKWNDPKNFPWSIALPWQPTYASEAIVYLRYLRQRRRDARIAILYQNDDAGKEYIRATREFLGSEADNVIAATLPFDVTDPTVDSQMVTLSATRADALMIYSVTPRACSQALRKAFELNWNVTRFLAGGCANPDTVLQPAGFNAAEGLITIRAFKSFEAAEQSDPDIIAYLDFMKRYAPGVRPTETFATYAYTSAGALIEVLKRAEEPLSRERIMAAATSLKKLRLPLFLPGITLSTSPDDFRPLRDGVLAQFHDGKWINLGDLVRGD